MNLLTNLVKFIIITIRKYNIDESHGLSHSLNVLYNAYNIYSSELPKNSFLKDQERVILVSTLVHDMCDKKYMSQDDGINEIELFLNTKISQEEIEVTKKIIATMSYSTVKKNGFPELNDYQLAYNIVREADLLAAIDFDRCMVYDLFTRTGNINDAYENAVKLFEVRVLKHDEDNLYVTEYSKNQDKILKQLAIQRINSWNKIINSKSFI
jgi:HD superfamily phosphodiesterase